MLLILIFSQLILGKPYFDNLCNVKTFDIKFLSSFVVILVATQPMSFCVKQKRSMPTAVCLL
jgi:hypothetical protein